MNVLIAYSFKGQEAHIAAPNFYKRCAEVVFPALSTKTDFLPDLSLTYPCRLLLAIGVRRERALVLASLLWLARHARRYDVVVGWVTNGVVAALLKYFVRTSIPRVCMILYRVNPSRPSGVSAAVKRAVLRVASQGADVLVALDQRQAEAFAVTLKRNPQRTVALRYGVDTEWYDRELSSIQPAPEARTIFVPGGAYRDDETLRGAITQLPIVVKRYQIDADRSEAVHVEFAGMARIEHYRNAPYERYLRDCVNAAVTVIAVHNHDAPAGLTALLECMAVGRPIIIADGASSRDYVRDNVNGLLYRPGDWRDLRDKIAYLISHPDAAAQLGAAARTAARETFGLQPCGVAFHAILQAIVSL